eukprot:jgi/Phyca11/18096/fgenesh1_pg.PHYCAscaffold_33_\
MVVSFALGSWWLSLVMLAVFPFLIMGQAARGKHMKTAAYALAFWNQHTWPIGKRLRIYVTENFPSIPSTTRLKPATLEGKIEFKNVHFRYRRDLKLRYFGTTTSPLKLDRLCHSVDPVVESKENGGMQKESLRALVSADNWEPRLAGCSSESRPVAWSDEGIVLMASDEFWMVELVLEVV